MARDKPYPVKYRSLKKEKVFGYAHYGPRPKIEVEASLQEPGQGRLLLGVLIHETLHLECPWLEETAVCQIEEGIARQLWAAGYRRVVE